MNDVGRHYTTARLVGVGLTRVQVLREDLVDGTALSRFPTGVVLVYEAVSLEDAAETMRRFRDSAHADNRRAVQATKGGRG